MSRLTLLLDGERFGGWKTVNVTRSLERASASFELSVSSREPWPIYTGAACEVYVDDDLLVTGWVDAYRPGCSASEHRIEVTGRSKTCDFVDSSVTIDGGQLRGMTVRQVAEVLAEPFGLAIVAEHEGEVVPEVQVQQSETCFKLVERLARLQELLVTDDAEGRLVLTRAGDKRSQTALRFGVNVKDAQADLDDSERFSHYIVKAQRPGNRTNDDKIAEGKKPWKDAVGPSQRSTWNANDWRAAWRQRMRTLQSDARRRAQRVGKPFEPDDPDKDDDFGEWDGEKGSGTDRETDRGISAITQVVGSARDYGITRYRPKVVVAEAQADDDNAEKRADWELRRRIGRSVKASVTVNGWRQEDGALWTPNLLIYTFIPWLGLEREMLIGEVRYSYDEGGEIAQLALTHPDAFLPDLVRRPKGKRGAGGGRVGGKKGKTTQEHWKDAVEPP
jgi:prophage tail gpP-like protein